jgi:hypothetical protein
MSSNHQIIKLLTILSFLVFFSIRPAFAQTAPINPPQTTCITPTGDKIVTYLDGIHGVPGNLQTFTGKDEVFALANDDALQCFCATNGTGVETIWWSSFTGLTQAEIDNLVAQGWVFVPNGSAWGLATKPYLAKNTNFTCSGNTTTSSNPSQPSTPGQVLSVSTLAQTGGKGLISTLIYTAFALLILGLSLKLLSFKKQF